MNAIPTQTLTGLERELLGYVEQLTRASQDCVRQLEELSNQSATTDRIEAGLKSLIWSQHLLIELVSGLIAVLPGGGRQSKQLADSRQALIEAAQAMDEAWDQPEQQS